MRFSTKELTRSKRRKRGRQARLVGRIAALFLTLLCFCLAPERASGFPAGSGKDRSSLIKEEGGELFQGETVAVYVVKKGDRLTDLARRFYGDPDKVWMIVEANELVALEPGQVLVIPLRPVNPGGLFADGYQVVSVLTYHHFSEQCTNTLCMPVNEFARQMAFLKKEGYRAINMKELLKFIDYQEPLPRKAVAITIDDGYRSVYDLAYPILKKHGFTATLFIYTDFIDNSPNALTWEQLKELARAGFEVESHTITHADLTLKRKGESQANYLQRIERELRVPRELIRTRLGQDPVWLAYPYGRYNNVVVSMAVEAGYRGGVTVTRGVTPFFTNPFRVGRIQVMNSVTGQSFEQLVKFFREANLQ
jgi:peptidoglycan/xylan/chitin deacetylase (PgdA/CDA1 family)